MSRFRFRMSLRAWFSACLLVLMAFSMLRSDTVSAVVPQPHGWVQVNTSGFGNPHNTFVASMAVYNDALYAGVTNRTDAGGGSVWRYVGGNTWEQADPLNKVSSLNDPAVVSMKVFNNKLYVGTAWSWKGTNVWNYGIYRYDGVNWERVFSLLHPANGFTAMEVYNGYLYVGVQYDPAVSPAQGSRILRSDTGDSSDWQSVVVNTPTDSIGGIANPDAYGITSLKAYNGSLVAAVAVKSSHVETWITSDGVNWSVMPGSANLQGHDPGGLTQFGDWLYLGIGSTTGGKLYRMNDSTPWEQVGEDGFGNPNNTKVEGVVVFRNSLYAHTYNQATGMEVWTSENGVDWRLDRAGGFGHIYNRNSLFNSAQAVFNERLYIGTSNYDPSAGGQIFALVENILYLPAVLR